MNQIMLVALAVLSCLLVAECHEEFHEHWKNFMHQKFCLGSNEDQEKYLHCAEMIPEQIKEHILSGTKTQSIRDASEIVCHDKVLEMKICEEIKEKKGEMGMDEAKIEELKECMKNAM